MCILFCIVQTILIYCEYYIYSIVDYWGCFFVWCDATICYKACLRTQHLSKHLLCKVICNIGISYWVEMWLYCIGSTDLHTSMPQVHVITLRIVPLWSLTLKIGLEALFVHLSAILSEIGKNDFCIMVSLICKKMVDGTLCQLFNIAHHFQHIFSIQETLIRSIFPGGAFFTPNDWTTWAFLAPQKAF